MQDQRLSSFVSTPRHGIVGKTIHIRGWPRWGIDSTVMAKLVRMGVLPILYYAAPIWASTRANQQTLRPLEVITRQLALIVTGCLKTTAYAPCHALSNAEDSALNDGPVAENREVAWRADSTVTHMHKKETRPRTPYASNAYDALDCRGREAWNANDTSSAARMSHHLHHSE